MTRYETIRSEMTSCNSYTTPGFGISSYLRYGQRNQKPRHPSNTSQLSHSLFIFGSSLFTALLVLPILVYAQPAADSDHSRAFEADSAPQTEPQRQELEGEGVGSDVTSIDRAEDFRSASLAASDCEQVDVEVRTVLASREGAERPEKIQIDNRLRDLAPKLQKLQYDRYQLLSSRRDVIPVTGRHTIFLSNGQRLILRPLYVKEERVGMWMKWDDSSGMEIIDTRMHFSCGEDALTALEANPEKGLILSVRVTPVRH